jgi:mRNA-degrading endonuclease YafQ of YafQ-DinJ toxin-antitoxin module
MKIALTERFQRDVRDLEEQQRADVLEVLLALPHAMGQPHAHAGLGMRKLHRSGIWEARMGLGLRLVFALEAGVLTLVRLGSHEEVRRYLRDLGARD